MKKNKLLLLIATLLVVATILCSCGTISSVNKFLNKEFDPTDKVYTEYSTISELIGYSVVDSNEEFVIFRSNDLTNVTYKIFSINASTVIATFADSSSIFDFELYDNIPLVTVAKATKPVIPTPEETPGEETPGEETPGEETPGEETPGEDTPVEE